MHLGSYDSEFLSFQKLEDDRKEHQLKRNDLIHKEIYLSDTRKVKQEDLKTVLRYRVEK